LLTPDQTPLAAYWYRKRHAKKDAQGKRGEQSIFKDIVWLCFAWPKTHVTEWMPAKKKMDVFLET